MSEPDIENSPPIIWLEPECCADPSVGRTWCQDDVYECEEGAKAVKYIRADLVTEGREQ